MSFDASLVGIIIEIIIIDLLLSGDNAVVIALACRALPERQRKIGVMLGAGAAVALRIIFTILITQILEIDYLKLVGGVLLLWIAVKLLVEEAEEADVKPSRSLWSAVRTVAVADAVMSLDNVVAIAAAAKGDMGLIVFGLVISVPLVVAGSAMLIGIINRYPGIVWGGGALLGWIAGDIISDDRKVVAFFGAQARAFDRWAPVLFAVLVVLAAWAILRRQKHGEREG